MSDVVGDHFSIPIHVLDRVSCEVPIEGFLTKDQTYVVLGLRSDEKRITLIDDRGLEMWARADRFRIWLSSEQLFRRLQEAGWNIKEIVLTEDRYYEKYGVEKASKILSSTECKDCGVKTIPGPGSARCAQCWEDRCGHD